MVPAPTGSGSHWFRFFVKVTPSRVELPGRMKLGGIQPEWNPGVELPEGGTPSRVELPGRVKPGGIQPEWNPQENSQEVELPEE